jgi:hypothetical protein
MAIITSPTQTYILPSKTWIYKHNADGGELEGVRTHHHPWSHQPLQLFSLVVGVNKISVGGVRLNQPLGVIGNSETAQDPWLLPSEGFRYIRVFKDNVVEGYIQR